MSQVLIHFKESYLSKLKELELDYKINDNEIDVILPDLEYDSNHYIKDPDEQFCELYGLDYQQVICIELVS